MELLSKYLNQPIIADQLQFGPAHTGMIDSGLNVNTMFDAAADRDGGVLEYCRLKDVTIQAWSPFQYGFFEGVFLGSDKYSELNKVISELAQKYGVTDNGIVTAWILRHPAKIMMVSGTMNAGRLAEIAAEQEPTRYGTAHYSEDIGYIEGIKYFLKGILHSGANGTLYLDVPALLLLIIIASSVLIVVIFILSYMAYIARRRSRSRRPFPN